MFQSHVPAATGQHLQGTTDLPFSQTATTQPQSDGKGGLRGCPCAQAASRSPEAGESRNKPRRAPFRCDVASFPALTSAGTEASGVGQGTWASCDHVKLPERDSETPRSSDHLIRPERDPGTPHRRDHFIRPERDTGTPHRRDHLIRPERDTGTPHRSDHFIRPERDTGTPHRRDHFIRPESEAGTSQRSDYVTPPDSAAVTSRNSACVTPTDSDTATSQRSAHFALIYSDAATSQLSDQVTLDDSYSATSRNSAHVTQTDHNEETAHDGGGLLTPNSNTKTAADEKLATLPTREVGRTEFGGLVTRPTHMNMMTGTAAVKSGAKVRIHGKVMAAKYANRLRYKEATMPSIPEENCTTDDTSEGFGKYLMMIIDNFFIALFSIRNELTVL